MTVSAATICQSGMSYPVAIEIARQINPLLRGSIEYYERFAPSGPVPSGALSKDHKVRVVESFKDWLGKARNTSLTDGSV